VAGACSDSGQKVHNLRCATADLPAEVEVLAFFDSDARPTSDALTRLVDCAGRSKRRVATGYRWLIPRRPTMANFALASVNASVASLMKRSGLNLIWGGCWAITRELFDETAVADAWRGTLSDDLVATRVLRIAGATIIFEPGCMCESWVDTSWKQAGTFLRRQFLIGRCYAGPWWWATLPLMLLQPVALLGGLALALAWLWNGTVLWYWPLFVSVILYASAALRAHWRQITWASRFPWNAAMLRSAARFDRWASMLSCLFATGAMLSSTVGRTIAWRGIHYHIGAAGRITLLGRELSERQGRKLLLAHNRRVGRDRAARHARLKTLERESNDTFAPLTSHKCSDEPIPPKRVA
jgi:hypothetical protein